MILTDVKIRLGCKDIEPEFTLHRTDVDPTRYPSANWDVEGAQNVEAWKRDCAEAFQEAVARARRKFDIAWTWCPLSPMRYLLGCAMPPRSRVDSKMDEGQVALVNILHKTQTDLGLPDRFVLDLVGENDWAFVIKSHALLEAAVTQTLTAELPDQRVHQLVASLNLAGRHSKLAYVRALNLLENKHILFLERLSQIRNTVVHDIAQVRFSFSEYLDRLTVDELAALLTNLLFIGPKDRAQAVEQLRRNAKVILWAHVVAVLAVCLTRRLDAEARRAIDRNQRDLAEAIQRAVPLG